jgi:hypothetical protein
MLDLIGTIILAAVIALNITTIGNAVPVSAATRLAIPIVAGAWTGLAAAVAAAGYFANATAPFPLIGVFVAFPLVAAAGAAVLIPSARAALLAVPMPTLIGLNIARVAGGFFVMLALADRLGGPFPQSAGWGDVITGVLALAVMQLAARGSTSDDRAVWLWNAFGTLDLVAAIALGVVSSNGSPLQLIHAGAGSAAVQVLPWVLIPTVLVPFYLITHGIVFAQLRARKTNSVDHGEGALGRAGQEPARI